MKEFETMLIERKQKDRGMRKDTSLMRKAVFLDLARIDPADLRSRSSEVQEALTTDLAMVSRLPNPDQTPDLTR